MPGAIHSQEIYRSDIVTISDVRCRPRRPECGPEEYSSTDSIAFARSGLFVKHVGRKEAVVDPNHVLFFGRDEVYRVSHPVPGGDDCTSFSYAPDVLRDAIGRFDPGVRDHHGGLISVSTCPSGPRSALLQHGLRRAARRSAPSIELDELAIDLLADVAKDAYRFQGVRPVKQRSDTQIAHRRLVDTALQLLSRHYREPLALSDIANRVHASPFHLSRIFRRLVGLPIHRYLNRLRLQAALGRLADGAENLTALALDLGYAGHSHLTDAFKREFHIPPSRFRDGLSITTLRQMSKNLEVPGTPLF